MMYPLTRRSAIKAIVSLAALPGRDHKGVVTISYGDRVCVVRSEVSEARVLFYVVWQAYLWPEADREYEHYWRHVDWSTENEHAVYSLMEPLDGPLHLAVEHAASFLNWNGYRVVIIGQDEYRDWRKRRDG